MKPLSFSRSFWVFALSIAGFLWFSCAESLWLEGLPCQNSVPNDCRHPQLQCIAGLCTKTNSEPSIIPPQETITSHENHDSSEASNPPETASPDLANEPLPELSPEDLWEENGCGDAGCKCRLAKFDAVNQELKRSPPLHLTTTVITPPQMAILTAERNAHLWQMNGIMIAKSIKPPLALPGEPVLAEMSGTGAPILGVVSKLTEGSYVISLYDTLNFTNPTLVNLKVPDELAQIAITSTSVPCFSITGTTVNFTVAGCRGNIIYLRKVVNRISSNTGLNLQAILGMNASTTWTKVAYSSNGQFLAAITSNRGGHLFSFSAGTLTRQIWLVGLGQEIPMHTQPITKLLFSPDNLYLGTLSSDGSFKLWSTTTGQLLATHTIPGEFPLDFAFSTSRTIPMRLLFSYPTTLKLYDLVTTTAGVITIQPNTELQLPKEGTSPKVTFASNANNAFFSAGMLVYKWECK